MAVTVGGSKTFRRPTSNINLGSISVRSRLDLGSISVDRDENYQQLLRSTSKIYW